eukprot:SAG22_NODE_6569_length_837_cov_1.084011_1_plen_113_part_01
MGGGGKGRDGYGGGSGGRGGYRGSSKGKGKGDRKGKGNRGRGNGNYQQRSGGGGGGGGGGGQRGGNLAMTSPELLAIVEGKLSTVRTRLSEGKIPNGPQLAAFVRSLVDEAMP